MGAGPAPLLKLGDWVLPSLELKEWTERRIREEAALQRARDEAAKVAPRLTPWNPNVFRMDGRVNTDEAVRSVNQLLRADPALKVLVNQELVNRLGNLAQAQEEGAKDWIQMHEASLNQLRAGQDPEYATQLNHRETQELKRILSNPSQWGETGTFQVGRFTVEMSVDRPASTGNISEMTTSSSTSTTTGTSSEHQSSRGHTTGRSIEMEAGLGKDGPSVSGKAGGSVETTSGSQISQGRSESTEASRSAETKNPGERQPTAVWATIKNEHGTSVMVNLGQVLVAQQK